MEVAIGSSLSSSSAEPGFDAASPFLGAPLSPTRFTGFYLSAPTSPARTSDFTRPIDWGEIHETGKMQSESVDFAFDFNEELERASLSADELFDRGRIKPLKTPTPPPPPPSQIPSGVGFLTSRLNPTSLPRSPKLQTTRGRDRKSPFEGAGEKTRDPKIERGRDRGVAADASVHRLARRDSRSLSPLRVSDPSWEDGERSKNTDEQPLSASKRFRKWSLKDFLLFRSASEGRAGDKNRIRHSGLLKKSDDVKNHSFRSEPKCSPGSSHGLHYTANRAATEDLKKKTFLPYKPAILGSGRPHSRHRLWFFGS